MYQFLRSLTKQDLFLRQVPAAAAAFAAASMFYKFGNFALECAGFLATWYVIDLVVAGALHLAARSSRRPAADQPPPGA